MLQFRDSNAPSEPLGWSFFGGVSEGDENPIEAIIRESKEELEIDIQEDEVKLLAEQHWVSPNTKREKMVYLFEYTKIVDWKDFSIREGAGAAFVSKDEVGQMQNISLLAKTFVQKYC